MRGSQEVADIVVVMRWFFFLRAGWYEVDIDVKYIRTHRLNAGDATFFFGFSERNPQGIAVAIGMSAGLHPPAQFVV